MLNPIKFIFCVLSLCFAFGNAIELRAEEKAEPSPYTLGSVHIKTGDNPDWANPSWDDSTWDLLSETTEPDMLPSPDAIPSGIFWLRIKIHIHDEIEPLASRILVAQIFGASETYWDGQLIGLNGVVGQTQAEESPGLLFKWSPIHDSLYTTGTHTVAIRISSNYNKPDSVPLASEFFIIKDTDAIGRIVNEVLPERFLLGLITITGVFYFLLFAIYERKLTYLLFGLVCSGVAAMEMLQGWSIVRMFSLTYDQATWLLTCIVLLLAVTSFLLPWYLLCLFSIGAKKRWLAIIGGLIGLSLIFGGSDEMRYVLSGLIGVVGGITISVIAAVQKKRGSSIVLIGIGLLLTSELVDAEKYSTSGFFAFVLCLLASLTLYMRDQRVGYQRSLLKEAKLQATKARLETELLKSSIQPHFLMNTLNALVDWVEENPKKGVKLILEIGRHFDMLIAISGKDTIPIKQEIEICQSFLSIMSYRTEIKLNLKTVNIDNSDTISPCIFHTLAENGITHNWYDAPEINFVLSHEKTKASRIYKFETPRGLEQKEIRSNRLSHGTGLKYVEARLEESYPGAWSLNQEGTDSTWVTKIEIQDT